MKWIRLLLVSLLSAGLFLLLDTRHGEIPPPAGFANPFAGFWQNNTSADRLPATLEVEGLHDSVRIVWDERRVPHIFASNAHDLFFAQGYCTARDRLWQMDFQARAGAGRLSEVVGPRTLDIDRHNRRIGLNVAAEIVARNTVSDPFMREVAESYCDGVNAWIRNLDERDYPVEFKILDYRPEEWTVYKTALIYSNFSLTLSFSNTDAALTATRDVLGDSLIAALYPDVLPFVDPVIPRGTRWDFEPLRVVRPPGEQFSTGPSIPGGTGVARPDGPVAEASVSPEPAVGSNNWAVSGSRTASGRPILCSDPHLGLTLPSIWYEVQLVSPDMNVYGVSSPGSPGVLIGFNRTIAFGTTNAGSDVLDWYRITFRDSSLNEYLYDGRWRETRKRFEVFQVRGAPAVVDTVIHTHHGPVVARPGERPRDQRVPPGCAMRWTALDSTNTIDAFLLLDKAVSYEEFVRALARFHGPAQNFVYADADNNIAVWHNGKFPLRWKDQGKYLCDGANPAREWQGWVPHGHLPHVLNPSRGFVSSANQPPADSTYPYYLGWNYAGFERSTRINRRLLESSKTTANDMMALQNDIFNPRAAKALPVLLPMINTASLGQDEKQVMHELSNWDFRHDVRSVSPQIFEYWWRQIHLNIWRDEFRQEGLLQPKPDITLRVLLADQQNPFIDNRDTPAIETLADIVRQSFSEAVRQMTADFGAFGPAWSWGKTRGTPIRHLAQIPGLGRTRMETAGNYNSINAITQGGGPSWRMVVELGPVPRGWGVYPGGQSGNPGSSFYDGFTDTWLGGEYYELIFLTRPNENHARLIATTTIGGRR